MEYKTVHDRITGLMETKDMEKLKVLHREMEIRNARMILDNRDGPEGCGVSCAFGDCVE